MTAQAMPFEGRHMQLGRLDHLIESTDAAGATPGRVRIGVWFLAGAVITLLMIGLIATTVGPRFLPYRTYAVQTGSMEPVMPVGSMVVVTPVEASDLEVGDIITFTPPGHGDELVTHRIVAKRSAGSAPVLLTKGDANDVRDSWQITARGTGWKVSSIVPHAGFVLSITTAPLGRLVLLGAMILWLCAVLLGGIWRSGPQEAQ